MPGCPHCRAGRTPVEVAGFQFHTFSDRWISCIGGTPEEFPIPPAVRLVSWIQLVFRSNLLSSSRR